MGKITKLELNLNILSLETDNYKTNKPYVLISLVNNDDMKIEKHKINIDKEGNNNVFFTNINPCTAAVRIEVFSSRLFLRDKCVGKLQVPASDFVLYRDDRENHETLVKREIVSSPFKKKKVVLNFSYKLFIEGKDFPCAVGSCDAGVRKIVPSYPMPFKSFNWFSK